MIINRQDIFLSVFSTFEMAFLVLLHAIYISYQWFYASPMDTHLYKMSPVLLRLNHQIIYQCKHDGYYNYREKNVNNLFRYLVYNKAAQKQTN